MDMIIQASYLIAAVLFILGLKQMSSPVTARHSLGRRRYDTGHAGNLPNPGSDQ